MTTCLNDPTTEYAQRVVAGEFISCKWEILAAKRHLEDLQKDWMYTFDTQRAAYVFNFFEKRLRHVKGELSGTPIILDEFTKFYLGCIFGWVRKDTGARRFSTGYIRVGRGNYKSTIQSGVALYCMSYDPVWIPGTDPRETMRFDGSPEVYCIAVDRAQANIIWGSAQAMASNSPDLQKILDIRKTSVRNKRRGGSLEKLSRDIKNKDGASPTAIIIDEYHAHPTSQVKDVASNGKGKRLQSVEIIITTAGEDCLNRPCYYEDNIVKDILSGKMIQDRYFGVIYELDEGDDVNDQRLWEKANPALRQKNQYSKTLREEIQTEHDIAYDSNNASKIRNWLIKRVNLWQTTSADKYFNEHCIERWQEGEVDDKTFNDLVVGRPMFYAFDLSKRIDLTANSYVWQLDYGRYAIDSTCFMPQNTLRMHEKSDKVPYSLWVKQGFLVLTPEETVDYQSLEDELSDRIDICGVNPKEVAYDPWKAHDYAIRLEEKGLTLIEIRQGIKTLSEPTQRFRDCLVSGKIVHRKNDLLKWCFTNAVEVCDINDNIRITKEDKNSTRRIDAAAAIISAFVRAFVPEKKILSYWEV